MDRFPDLGAAPEAAALDARNRPMAHALGTPDRRRRTRLDGARQRRQYQRQLLIVGGFAALYLFALLVFHALGLLPRSTLAAAALASALAIGVFCAVFACGLNRRAAEPSLGAPMALCGLAILLWVMYMAPATHILFAPHVFVTIAFGTYRLSTRTMVLLALAALAGFGAVIQLHYFEGGEPGLLQSELLHLLTAALALPGLMLLAVRVRRMNNALFKAGLKIENIKENARRDPLLGCYNRRYAIAALEQHKRHAEEHGSDLCLAVIDLDYFKRVNDEIGHLGGDEVLRDFSRVAQANVRQGDVFGRYGGEEFLLILPETDLLTALNITERIRAQVEHHRWDEKLKQGVTVSIGLTQYIAGESVLDLFSRTDTAAYMAKRGGRNQVVVEEPPPA